MPAEESTSEEVLTTTENKNVGSKKKDQKKSPVLYIVVGLVTLLLLCVCVVAIFLFLRNRQDNKPVDSSDQQQEENNPEPEVKPAALYYLVNCKFYKYQSKTWTEITSQLSGYAVPAKCSEDAEILTGADQVVDIYYQNASDYLHKYYLVNPEKLEISEVTGIAGDKKNDGADPKAAVAETAKTIYFYSTVNGGRLYKTDLQGKNLKEVADYPGVVYGRGISNTDDVSLYLNSSADKLIINDTFNAVEDLKDQYTGVKVVDLQGKILFSLKTASNAVWLNDHEIAYWNDVVMRDEGTTYDAKVYSYDLTSKKTSLLLNKEINPIRLYTAGNKLYVNAYTRPATTYDTYVVDLTSKTSSKLAGEYFLPRYLETELLGFNAKVCELDPGLDYTAAEKLGKMECPADGPTNHYSSKLIAVEAGAEKTLLEFAGSYAE